MWLIKTVCVAWNVETEQEKQKQKKQKLLSDYFIYDTLECRLNTRCHLFSTGEEQKKAP